MSLLQLIVSLVVIGAILWVINAFIPMNATVKGILNIVVIIVIVLYVLRAFGLIHSWPRLLIIG